MSCRTDGLRKRERADGEQADGASSPKHAAVCKVEPDEQTAGEGPPASGHSCLMCSFVADDFGRLRSHLITEESGIRAYACHHCWEVRGEQHALLAHKCTMRPQWQSADALSEFHPRVCYHFIACQLCGLLVPMWTHQSQSMYHSARATHYCGNMCNIAIYVAHKLPKDCVLTFPYTPPVSKMMMKCKLSGCDSILDTLHDIKGHMFEKHGRAVRCTACLAAQAADAVPLLTSLTSLRHHWLAEHMADANSIVGLLDGAHRGPLLHAADTADHTAHHNGAQAEWHTLASRVALDFAKPAMLPTDVAVLQQNLSAALDDLADELPPTAEYFCCLQCRAVVLSESGCARHVAARHGGNGTHKLIALRRRPHGDSSAGSKGDALRTDDTWSRGREGPTLACPKCPVHVCSLQGLQRHYYAVHREVLTFAERGAGVECSYVLVRASLNKIIGAQNMRTLSQRATHLIKSDQSDKSGDGDRSRLLVLKQMQPENAADDPSDDEEKPDTSADSADSEPTGDRRWQCIMCASLPPVDRGRLLQHYRAEHVHVCASCALCYASAGQLAAHRCAASIGTAEALEAAAKLAQWPSDTGGVPNELGLLPVSPAAAWCTTRHFCPLCAFSAAGAADAYAHLMQRHATSVVVRADSGQIRPVVVPITGRLPPSGGGDAVTLTALRLRSALETAGRGAAAQCGRARSASPARCDKAHRGYGRSLSVEHSERRRRPLHEHLFHARKCAVNRRCFHDCIECELCGVSQPFALLDGHRAAHCWQPPAGCPVCDEQMGHRTIEFYVKHIAARHAIKADNEHYVCPLGCAGEWSSVQRMVHHVLVAQCGAGGTRCCVCARTLHGAAPDASRALADHWLESHPNVFWQCSTCSVVVTWQPDRSKHFPNVDSCVLSS